MIQKYSACPTKIHPCAVCDSGRSARHPFLQKQLRLLAFCLTLFLVAAIISLFLADLANDILALSKPSREIRIVIRAGDSHAAVVGALRDAGVIRYKTVFFLLSRSRLRQKQFPDATLTFSSPPSYQSLIRMLCEI